MKTLMVTIAAAMMALNVAAHNPGVDPADYCLKKKSGKIMVERNGSAITKEIKFKDGTRLEPNGTVHLTSGKTVKLKEGECVNESSVLDLNKHRNDNIGDQKDYEYNKGKINNESDMNKPDSTKTNENLDPDRYKNDQSNPPQKTKDSDSDIPKK
jgi:hypothetical protein